MSVLTEEQPEPPRPATRPLSPLETAEDAFTWLVTGPAPLAVNGRHLPGLPDRRVPLHQLRARLASRPMRRSEIDAVWAHLVVRARASQLPARRAAWTLGCVGVAMPNLAHVAAVHSLTYAGDPADIEAAVLAAFVVELHQTDICVPRIPRRLQAAADRAARALADAVHTTRRAAPTDRGQAPTAAAAATPVPAEATAGTATETTAETTGAPATSAPTPPCHPAITPAVMPARRPGAARPGAARAGTDSRGQR